MCVCVCVCVCVCGGGGMVGGHLAILHMHCTYIHTQYRLE